mmetsp:Transcript_8941/g.23261  ORF Transcript_8941/g.23261 Transcript_8941/m.23261 type:complete len:422 (+) Transcript_8941:78-1343(+)
MAISYPPTADHLLDASEVREADPAKGIKSVYLGLDTRLPEVTAERAEEIKKKFPHFPGIYDQRAVRREYLVRLPRAIEDWANRHLITDPRDTIMLSTMANMFVCSGTLSAMLFRYPSHWFGLMVALSNALLWTQRFILMLHYAEHRPLFHKSVGFLRYVMPWVMAPFYGIPTGVYRTHHIVMHHKENNVFERDLSSTEPYQRDNFLHFVHYWLKFLALVVTLPFFAIKRRRWDALMEVCLGFGVWMMAQALLHKGGHGLYALYQFQVPFLISSIALMFGNWSQHIFVHPLVAEGKEDKGSIKYNCALTVNVMNHFDNQVAFNDGYHVVHHIRPRCHWTEMPTDFLENLESYAEHDPICIDRAGFFDLGFNFLIRQKFDPDGAWKWIVDRFVHLTPEKRSFDEVKALLQERLRPIPNRAGSK